jgi:ribosome-associated toxin RatA of RatAB toxin-antitoxin module
MRALLSLALLLTAGAASADELENLLKAGPFVQVRSHESGEYKEALAIGDIDAPAHVVWRVMTDFESYPDFMPRVKKMTVEERKPREASLAFVLDTPLFATRYTNHYTLDPEKRRMRVRQAKGDLKGSHQAWALVPRGERTRLYISGVVKNYSSVAQSFEDEQQTLTIGINVVTMVSLVKAVKTRAEALHRQRLAKH